MANMSNISRKRNQRTGADKPRAPKPQAASLEGLEERRLLSGGLPPVVTIASGGYAIQPEESLMLEASASDPDAEPGDVPLSYAWDLDGDNAFDDAFTANPTVAWTELERMGYAAGMTRTLTLRVTDAAGAMGFDTTQLTILEKDPEVDGPATVDEGAPYTITMGYWYADRQLSHWMIEWGDGAVEFTDGPVMQATHVYADNAPIREVFVSAIDTLGGQWPALIPAVVEVLNLAPQADIPNLPQVPVQEGLTPALSITASDVPADSVSLSWRVLRGAEVIASGSDTEIPPLLADGTYTIQITAADDDGGIGTSEFVLIVENVAPVAGDDTVSGLAGQTITGNVLVNDSDQGGDSLTVRLVSGPVTGLVLSADGSFTYAAPDGAGATVTFSYVSSDGLADSNVATVTISVTGTNVAPVGHADAFALDEDQAFAGNVLDNDTDADGDPLVVSLISGPGSGSLMINPDGSFTYAPAADFHGQDGFVYTATDPSGLTTGPVHVTLTVLSVPDAPLISAAPVTTAEDTPATVSVAVSDVENDVTQILVVSGPQHGTLEAAGAGVWMYHPDANYSGADEFVVKAVDATGLKTWATLHIDVTPVNDLPQFGAPVTSFLDEDASVQGWLPVVDVDGDAIEVLRVQEGIGSVRMNPDGTFIYTAAPDYSGPDAFRVWVTDASGIEVSGELQFYVNRVNDAPLAHSSSITLAEDTPAAGTLAGHDVDGDALTFSLLSGPGHGTAVLNADGTFVYTPAADYYGADQFTFRSFDGTAHSAVASVSITVIPVNERPVATPDSVTAAQDTRRIITFADLTANDVDPDGQVLGVRVVDGPAFGTLTQVEGKLIYVPSLGFSGGDAFTYVVTDGEFESEVVSVTIEVARAASGSIILRPDGVLVINGSLGNDVILLSSASNPGCLKISFSGALGTFTKEVDAPSKRIVVFGHSGDDEIRVGHSIETPAWLYGDEGNDALELGSQGGIAFGGWGNDRIGGGGGRDLLIGGEGADDLVGAGDGDILIAPRTIYDDRFTFSKHEQAWTSIQREWNSSRSASQRINNLRDGTGSGYRENGSYFLNRDTVRDDQASWPQDTLSGRGGADWYFFKADEDKATGSGYSDLL
jgi:VCBS repeat-containing protein